VDIKLRQSRDSLPVGSWNVNKADINSRCGNRQEEEHGRRPKADQGAPGGESLLFLTDEQLRKGIEAMFFAYRGFTADPDRILEEQGYGRAHHRAIHFINRSPEPR
jgi:hypothetical protein